MLALVSTTTRIGALIRYTTETGHSMPCQACLLHSQSMLCTWNVDRSRLNCKKADVTIEVPVSIIAMATECLPFERIFLLYKHVRTA